MKEPDYRGVAALMIAICGAFGIFIIVPIGLIYWKMTLGEAGSEVLIALGGVFVGAFATYMGMRYADPPRTKGFEDPTDPNSRE